MEIFITSFLSTLVVYWIAYYVCERKWKKELIKRGLAQYNLQTDKWEWIEK